MTESTIKDIRYDDILDGYKTEVKSQVQSGLTIVQYYYDQYKDGQMTENVSTIAQQIASTNEVIIAFSLIEAGISETNEKIEKISEVISDTMEEINSVSTQVEEIEESAQSTAAAGQQVTASTQELASLMNSVEGDISELAASSHELDRKMDRFKV